MTLLSISFYVHSGIDLFPFKAWLYIRFRTFDPYWTPKSTLKIPRSSQLSVICVMGHIKTMHAYIGQYVTCQNQACLFEVIEVIDLIIDDVSRLSMFHVFTIFKAESISYRHYVSIYTRFTG